MFIGAVFSMGAKAKSVCADDRIAPPASKGLFRCLTAKEQRRLVKHYEMEV